MLLLLTLFTTTTLGGIVYRGSRTDTTTELSPILSPQTVSRVWSDTELVGLGLCFSLPLLIILLSHELGHYLACRYYGIAATVPYFLPAPFFIGTFGAFIRIRGRITNKTHLFDVGIAGPLAGFVALLPFLVLGIAWSEPGLIHPAAGAATADALLYKPGSNLAFLGLGLVMHGNLPDNGVLDLHPFALAAWVGLLATSLNLLPLGQLDGGHLLYASASRLHRRAGWPIWLALCGLGVTWNGWFLWCLLVLIIGLRHPPVAEDSAPLAASRRPLAGLALVILILSFTPQPLSVVFVRDPPGLLVEVATELGISNSSHL